MAVLGGATGVDTMVSIWTGNPSGGDSSRSIREESFVGEGMALEKFCRQ